jgi:hypothetical protein
VNAESSTELHPVDVDQPNARPALTLYHLVRLDSVDWDEAQEVVVSAAHVEQARQVAADASRSNTSGRGKEVASWLDSRRSTVTELVPGPAPRVVVYNVYGG